jgi:hypothetical protein
MDAPELPLGKRCCTCKEWKAYEEFNRLTRSVDGRQPSCRECNRAYHRNNWDRHMAQIRARTRRIRAQYQRWIVEYLREHPCVDCGETDIVVLEFDHLRDKVANISTLISSAGSWDTIVAEIEKCEVRCANCHRRRTAERGGWYRNLLK